MITSKDIQFKIHTTDSCGARRGQFTTQHGTVQTPAFMVVGTFGFFRCITPKDVLATNTEVALANTYHLSLSEKLLTIKRCGGLHKFMGWNKTILTDSGGFQVFSLPGREITDDGVLFSFTEGEERIFLSPERAMEIQRDLGADIVMAFDECVEYPAEERYVKQAVDRTTNWAKRCREVPLQNHQFLFGIIQGGVYKNLRHRSAKAITEIPFDGFAIGGVSVGEGLELLKEIVSYTSPLMPQDKPRYLMGVGLPEDIFASVQGGMDMFDCIIPTRYARNGLFFTRTGKMRIKDKTYRKDKYPVDTECKCYTCQTYSRMVLRYLFFSEDPLAQTLATLHNITFYQDLMQDIRDAISNNSFIDFKKNWLSKYLKSKNI
ncbi:MAG: tRNA guanosine(34) transglycosylase Tgt [Desulfobacterales bacterium]|nr:tRNA guanosine(34) transglycosylase Tgt [Desulfobacterales bacterium]MBF0397276.1 tRNA guanosine(34) transglycosylase Tgt [Desulfobacterales bacterium]